MTRQELRNDLTTLETENVEACRAWARGDKAAYAARDTARTAVALRIRAGAEVSPARLAELMVQSRAADVGGDATRLEAVRTELRAARLR